MISLKLPFKTWVFYDLCPRKITSDLNDIYLGMQITALTGDFIIGGTNSVTGEHLHSVTARGDIERACIQLISSFLQ